MDPELEKRFDKIEKDIAKIPKDNTQHGLYWMVFVMFVGYVFRGCSYH